MALRPRLALSYSIGDKLTLTAEAEARFRFDERDEWVRNRRTIGLTYDFSDRIYLDGFYRRQRDINMYGPDEASNIFGLYLGYVLPDDRNRDWEYRRPFGTRVF